MIRGFTFGKYLPFHLGHKALIDYGIKHCDELVVVVCASDKEDIPIHIRTQWITETYIHLTQVKVVPLSYSEADLPNTSVSSPEVSRIWAEKFSAMLSQVDLVFTSEPYGDYVASYMGIRHFMFDQHRQNLPISGTAIRTSIYRHWDMLPAAVKAYYQRTLIVLGTESTGKSTLCEYLHQQYSSSLVKEAGRDIVEHSDNISKEQLMRIAKMHAQQIMRAKAELQPLVVVDTDVHITQSYARYCFSEYLALPQSIYEVNTGDLYIYLDKDAPYIQDGSRLSLEDRNTLDNYHRQTLADFDINFVIMKGDYESRRIKTCKLVDELLKL